jgi:hypothetical protein
VHGLWAGYDRRLHVSVPRNASRLRDAFDRDRRKDAGAASAGNTTLRFSADQIERDLGEVIDTIVRVRDAHGAGKDEPKFLSRARFRTIRPLLARIRTDLRE